ncbi:Carbamoyl-phosphate synthase small chain, chloroplastic [Glycine soja]
MKALMSLLTKIVCYYCMKSMSLNLFWHEVEGNINHNYAVDPATLSEGVEVTHRNLNDGSCVGLAFPAQRIMSLQYHPEASPGLHDFDYTFRELVELMKQEKKRKSCWK